GLGVHSYVLGKLTLVLRTRDGLVPAHRRDPADWNSRKCRRSGRKGRLFICWSLPQFMRQPSDRHDAVIVVHLAIAGGVAPVPVALAAIFRSAAQLILGDASAVAAEPRVVFQRLPRQR